MVTTPLTLLIDIDQNHAYCGYKLLAHIGICLVQVKTT